MGGPKRDARIVRLAVAGGPRPPGRRTADTGPDGCLARKASPISSSRYFDVTDRPWREERMIAGDHEHQVAHDFAAAGNLGVTQGLAALVLP